MVNVIFVQSGMLSGDFRRGTGGKATNLAGVFDEERPIVKDLYLRHWKSLINNSSNFREHTMRATGIPYAA